MEAALLRPLCQATSEPPAWPERRWDVPKEPALRIQSLKMAGRRASSQERGSHKLEAAIQAEAQLDERELCRQRNTYGRTGACASSNCSDVRRDHLYG